MSDKIELNRTSTNYDIDYERFVAEKDLNTVMLIILNMTINKLVSKGSIINLDTVKTRNAILMGKF